MNLCPHCDRALTVEENGRLTLDVCPQHHGLMLPNNQLIPLLQRVAEDLNIDPDSTIEAVEPNDAVLNCPSCRRPMKRFGYLGTNLAHLDRCAPCGLLWIPRAALAPLATLYQRTQLRTKRRHRQDQQRLREQDRRLLSILEQRAASNALF